MTVLSSTKTSGGSTKAIGRSESETGSLSPQATTAPGSCTTWRPTALKRTTSPQKQPDKVRELAKRWQDHDDEFTRIAKDDIVTPAPR